MQLPYWYVYKRGGGAPRFQHTSYDEALREAKRLIDRIGGEYEILEVQAVVKPAPMYVIETPTNTSLVLIGDGDEDDIPFDDIPF